MPITTNIMKTEDSFTEPCQAPISRRYQAVQLPYQLVLEKQQHEVEQTVGALQETGVLTQTVQPRHRLILYQFGAANAETLAPTSYRPLHSDYRRSPCQYLEGQTTHSFNLQIC